MHSHSCSQPCAASHHWTYLRAVQLCAWQAASRCQLARIMHPTCLPACLPAQPGPLHSSPDVSVVQTTPSSPPSSSPPSSSSPPEPSGEASPRALRSSRALRSLGSATSAHAAASGDVSTVPRLHCSCFQQRAASAGSCALVPCAAGEAAGAGAPAGRQPLQLGQGRGAAGSGMYACGPGGAPLAQPVASSHRFGAGRGAASRGPSALAGLAACLLVLRLGGCGHLLHLLLLRLLEPARLRAQDHSGRVVSGQLATACLSRSRADLAGTAAVGTRQCDLPGRATGQSPRACAASPPFRRSVGRTSSRPC